jgi:hypothetical protein
MQTKPASIGWQRLIKQCYFWLMKFTASKWLAYTFLVGLIPALVRLLTWSVAVDGRVQPLFAPDFVTFGLVLHISLINETEYLPTNATTFKTLQNGVSIVFVTLYSALYAVTVICERTSGLLSLLSTLRASAVLAFCSSVYCLAVCGGLSKRNWKWTSF